MEIEGLRVFVEYDRMQLMGDELMQIMFRRLAGRLSILALCRIVRLGFRSSGSVCFDLQRNHCCTEQENW